MHTASEILVIIVSSVLAIFLTVLIVLVVLAIKLIKQLKIIVDRAERAVDSVSTAGAMLRDASGPLAILKLVRNIVRHSNGSHRSKK